MRAILNLALACLACACTDLTSWGSPPLEEPGPSVPPSGGGTAAAGTDACRGIALPAERHYVAAGLCARAVISKQGKLRQLTFAPNGDLFGVTADGVIRRYRDNGASGNEETLDAKTWAKLDGNGNNVAFDPRSGHLYAGTTASVRAWAYGVDGPRGESRDVVTGVPAGGNHALHTVHVYDGYLYVHSGSRANVDTPSDSRYDENRSVIKRFELARLGAVPFAWDDGEVFAKGLRNMVGFTRAPNGRLYGVDNGIDWVTYRGMGVTDDNPGEAVELLEPGRGYGYPFCFTAQRIVAGGALIPPGTQLHTEVQGEGESFQNPHDDMWCKANATPPVTFLQAHTAPLDITFFDKAPAGALPERWRNGAFVSMHGSWNRSPSTGHKVVWIPFDAQGRVPMPTSTGMTTQFPYEVVFGGGKAGSPSDGSWGWRGESNVRPVGVAISPKDGALYISSDNNGVIYRITFAR